MAGLPHTQVCSDLQRTAPASQVLLKENGPRLTVTSVSVAQQFSDTFMALKREAGEQEARKWWPRLESSQALGTCPLSTGRMVAGTGGAAPLPQAAGQAGQEEKLPKGRASLAHG